MTLDWVTIAAQAVNFLILVWLLKRFLYRPVLNAMNRREQRIADRLQEAARRSSEAEETRRDFERRRSDLDAERETVLSAAREEAQALRDELTARTRTEIDGMRARLADEVARERRDFVLALRREAAETILAQTRKVLAELADETLEHRVAAHLARRLTDLDEASIHLLRSASAIRVLSAFEIGGPEREALTAAVASVTAEAPEIRFERDGALICGAAIVAEGLRIDWSLDGHLDAVSRRLEEYLAREDLAGAR